MQKLQVTENVEFTAGADEALGARFPKAIRRSSLPGNRVRRGILVVAMLAAVCSAARAGDSIPPGPTCPGYLSYIPTWNIPTDNGFLCFVGSDPVQSGTTIIMTPVVPVVIRVLGANGTVEGISDPTKPLYVNPTKTQDFSALSAVLESPVFQAYDFKLGPTSLGNMQWGQAVEEASFWKYPRVNFKDWNVIMAPLPFPAVTLDVPYGNWYPGGSTPHFYGIDQNVLKPFLEKQMAATPAGMAPIYLTYNISEYPPGNPAGGPTWGFHETYQHTPGIFDSFIYATYLDTPQPNSDLMPLSHEVAEFMQDPFGNNPVQGWPQAWTFPLPWKPPYTFTKCQTNLEAGDPLEDRFGEPSEMQLPLTNSTMTYNFQNEVTASWLMQASFSVNGWYTLKGPVDKEFAAPAPKCPGVLK
jgi:hypothetical protein